MLGYPAAVSPKVDFAAVAIVLLSVEGRSDFSWALSQPMGPCFAKLESPSLPAYFCLLTHPATQSYRPGTAPLTYS